MYIVKCIYTYIRIYIFTHAQNGTLKKKHQEPTDRCRQLLATTLPKCMNKYMHALSHAHMLCILRIYICTNIHVQKHVAKKHQKPNDRCHKAASNNDFTIHTHINTLSYKREHALMYICVHMNMY